LPAILVDLHVLVSKGKVRFTHKSLMELTNLDLGLDVDDACDVLLSLAERDFTGRVDSRVTGEWMYVFKPKVAGIVMYVKLIIRNDCVVVSFHEDADDKET
jgi:hypothetical protein